ncbi:MAG TPA: hypothetical protein VLF60_04945 [Candidatus Saccharimonadales bacterium]|nr:hypothetical protein [Candidatus Saccharimonadales bacterium]
MARLPNPGSDSGSWGAILNDYLLQVHAADGMLKASSVGTSQLQDGAITSAKVANGAITAAKLAPEVGGADGLRSLIIYYAPASIINAKYDNDYAAGVLSRYDDVVLGTGLEDPGNSDYANTTAIIHKIAALSPGTVVWGYIDCGVTTGNLSLSTLQTQIDQWISIGAKGIFCDVIGYAYGVSRARQNSIIDYVHSKGVGAILNVFNPDEVFSSAVNATYNPGGTVTHANSQDVHLLESWVFNSDSYSSPYYATFSDIKTRGDASRAYRSTLGIRIFTANIIGYTGRTDNEIDAYRGVGEALARIWRLDGFGVAASTYAATGADVGLVRPRFPLLRSNQLRSTAPYTLNGLWTQVEAADLGIIVNYDTGVHTWTQV